VNSLTIKTQDKPSRKAEDQTRVLTVTSKSLTHIYGPWNHFLLSMLNTVHLISVIFLKIFVDNGDFSQDPLMDRKFPKNNMYLK